MMVSSLFYPFFYHFRSEVRRRGVSNVELFHPLVISYSWILLILWKEQNENREAKKQSCLVSRHSEAQWQHRSGQAWRAGEGSGVMVSDLYEARAWNLSKPDVDRDVLSRIALGRPTSFLGRS